MTFQIRSNFSALFPPRCTHCAFFWGSVPSQNLSVCSFFHDRKDNKTLFHGISMGHSFRWITADVIIHNKKTSRTGNAQSSPVPSLPRVSTETRRTCVSSDDTPKLTNYGRGLCLCLRRYGVDLRTEIYSSHTKGSSKAQRPGYPHKEMGRVIHSSLYNSLQVVEGSEPDGRSRPVVLLLNDM